MMAVKSSGFIVSLIILISLVGLFGVVMPWLGLKSASEPVTSPPTDAIAYQEVSFTSDGLTLNPAPSATADLMVGNAARSLALFEITPSRIGALRSCLIKSHFPDRESWFMDNINHLIMFFV